MSLLPPSTDATAPVPSAPRPQVPEPPGLEDRRMSYLWALTLIIIAGGLGFIAGLLLIMFGYVIRSTGQSEFFGKFEINSAVHRASDGKVSWSFPDAGSYVYSYRSSQPRMRRFMAEATIPAADQAAFLARFEMELQAILAREQPGLVINSGSGSSTGSTALPNGRLRTFKREWKTMMYNVGNRTGTIQLWYLTDDDRVTLLLVIEED